MDTGKYAIRGPHYVSVGPHDAALGPHDAALGPHDAALGPRADPCSTVYHGKYANLRLLSNISLPI